MSPSHPLTPKRASSRPTVVAALSSFAQFDKMFATDHLQTRTVNEPSVLTTEVLATTSGPVREKGKGGDTTCSQCCHPGRTITIRSHENTTFSRTLPVHDTSACHCHYLQDPFSTHGHANDTPHGSSLGVTCPTMPSTPHLQEPSPSQGHGGWNLLFPDPDLASLDFI